LLFFWTYIDFFIFLKEYNLNFLFPKFAPIFFEEYRLIHSKWKFTQVQIFPKFQIYLNISLDFQLFAITSLYSYSNFARAFTFCLCIQKFAHAFKKWMHEWMHEHLCIHYIFDIISMATIWNFLISLWIHAKNSHFTSQLKLFILFVIFIHFLAILVFDRTRGW
jgi:hypothetical protein